MNLERRETYLLECLLLGSLVSLQRLVQRLLPPSSLRGPLLSGQFLGRGPGFQRRLRGEPFLAPRRGGRVIGRAGGDEAGRHPRTLSR